jgi:uncharacterized damage-inducible protein DinB
MPAAHALGGAAEDIRAAAADLTPEQLWSRPGGAPSVGFHLRHVAGSLDRLLTYARGESLTDAQMAFLQAEGEPGADAAELLRAVDDTIAIALAQIRATQSDLLAPRVVGRKKLPSTVIGLLFHAAEHTQRHTGQIVTTTRIARGLQ